MAYSKIKRILLGEPLLNEGSPPETIPKWKALSTLSADALSSVAYATDAILFALLGFSTAAMVWSLPIAIAISGLLLILTISYRQTIDAYPARAGAYTVSRANLGDSASLLAGASLLIDYILTVSVSVAAGIANISSAFPSLLPHSALLGVLVIVSIMFLNLRGVRESGALFVFPTYFFIISLLILVAGGFYKAVMGQAPPVAPLIHEIYPQVPLVLILRAFASGCVALTGVETIANNLSVFQPPAERNAKTTLVIMSIFLGIFFLGITALVHIYGLGPSSEQTVLSSLGHAVFGNTAFYYLIQLSTAFILFRAANTSYMGFPRLASLLARDRYLPRQLTGVGDRLVFSNGIIGLSLISALLIVIFNAQVIALIPLYAVGVFLTFTLSQSGMVVHHLREKKPGWIKPLVFNAAGATTTLVVLIDVIFAKFTHGAWLVVLMVPFLLLVFTKIQKHYLTVGKQLNIPPVKEPIKFNKVKHTVIIPVSGIHKGVIEALRYALSVSEDVRACYVEIDPASTERMKELWTSWAPQVPFVILKSPYRSVIGPIIKYIDDVEKVAQDDMVTVVVPEFVTSRWWHRLLHNQTALFMRTALASRPGTVVTSVRYHLDQPKHL